MKVYQRFSTLAQMAVSVATFAALLLLLESGGLVDWAQRLDQGPERTVAVPLTAGLHAMVGRFGLEPARKAALVDLARIGWSDDPASIARNYALAVQPQLTRPPAVAPAANPTSAPAGTVPAPAHELVRADAASPGKDAVSKSRRVLRFVEPPLISQLPPLPPIPAGSLRTVALAGDSMMAVGLSPTMLRAAPQYKGLTMIRVFKSGTGLSRPEVFNWSAQYPAMLGAAKPDIVVVAIGANDGQGFIEEGVTYPFGTPAWQVIYQARVEAYLAMLQTGGATVVWLGLPPMKSDAYDSRIALVNRIDYEVMMASPNAVWFSTAGLVGDSGGKFQDFGSVHGSTARLRQPDGIHLSDDGASLIAERLLPWLAK
jgi:lysophospholipase L1-like esterase